MLTHDDVQFFKGCLLVLTFLYGLDVGARTFRR